MAGHVDEGVYGDHQFITIPRPPTEAERELNKVPNHVWPDLYFETAKDDTEAVYVKVSSIPAGTLLPFGGDLVTHWEYLARKAVQASAVSTWIPLEDADLDGRPLWFIPETQNPLVVSLHTRVGTAVKKRSTDVNVEIVWSVFPAPEFSSSARLFYCTLRDLNRSTRLRGPPVAGFFAKHMWGQQARLAAQTIRSRFLAGEKCPHSSDLLERACLGHPGRAERIYGAYRRTDGGDRAAAKLPASCISLPVEGGASAVSASLILPVPATQPAVTEGTSIPAPGEDLAVTVREDPAVAFHLPPEYHGVLIQPVSRVKFLTLTASFMDPSFEPASSWDPPRATLAEWWKAVSKRIRESYSKMAMPDDLKKAMRGRAKLYSAPVGEIADVVDLAVEAADGDLVVEAADEGSPPAKRSRRSVPRPRAVASSSSSSGRGVSGTGMDRGVISQPRSMMRDSRGPGATQSGVGSAPASGGAGGALSAEEVELFKALLLRVLERL